MMRAVVAVACGAMAMAAALGAQDAKPQAAAGAPRFSARLLAVDTNEGCDVGDVNKDGVMDITAGRFWFAGPDFVARPVRAMGEFDPDYSNSCGEHLLDVDGDGWLDVISIGFHDTKLHGFKNPGAQALAFGRQWPAMLLVDTKLASNEANWLRDMDGDGAPEFMVNSWNNGNPMVYWKLGKDEKGQPTATRVTIAEKGNGHGQGYGDINGDGREDIVFGRGWYERPAEPGGAWKLHSDFNLPDASCPIIVTDVDGDGRNDLVWGRGHNYGLHWWKQLEPAADGKTQWKDHLIDKEWSQAHTLAYADINGDGRSELITGKRVRAHGPTGDPGSAEPPSMYLYKYDAAKGAFERHLIAAGVGTGLQIRIADMNGDGLADIVTAGKNGVWLLTQQGEAPTRDQP